MEKDYLWWKLPEVAKAHDEMNRPYFEKEDPGQYPYFSVLVDAMKLVGRHAKVPLEVLDIGCGAGWQAVWLDKCGFPLSYKGLDISEPMCELARKNYPNGEFFVADVMEYTPDQKWDIVMCCGSIEHFDDWEGFVKKMKECSNEWLIIHKIFFHDGEKPTEKQSIPTYCKRKQTRMVLSYSEFQEKMAKNNLEIVKRFDWDQRAVSCIVLKVKK